MDGTADDLDRLQREVDALICELPETEQTWRDQIERVSAEHRNSAVNLVHYLSIRQLDLRDLQWRLQKLGLSSLGLSEAHVQATLQLVSRALTALRGVPAGPPSHPVVEMGEGEFLLHQNAVDLLGRAPADRTTRIMVTLPSDAAVDRALVRSLVESGMGIARINCAHDDALAWKAMAANVREAANAVGRPCLVAMDLAGPKLRTGPLTPGPKVVRIRPRRNALGQVVTAGRGWLTSADQPQPPPEPGLVTMPIDGAWLARLAVGDELVLRDTRRSRRRLQVASVGPGGCVVTTRKTVYVGTGTVLKVAGENRRATVGELPPVESVIPLTAGETLLLTRDCDPALVDQAGPPRIGCTLPEIFDNAAIDDRVFLDDGKLGGKVSAIGEDSLEVLIEHPSHRAVKLRGGKGVNVPDTDLPIRALTDKDIADLSAVAEIADIVNISFVRSSDDLAPLFDELDRLGDPDLGVVLKLETRQAFGNLPQLILTAMQRRRVGVMIARGDLAVECGYERLAELQEEALRMCEAAHLPVIWATQVLEQLAKTGNPSRAEITDAAMSERAECVMLNKGPYILDAVTALDDILCRMAALGYKKSSFLKELDSLGRPE